MQTGEYRGFVGQFPVWLREQLAIWRAPVLLSLALHAVLFWPKSLQESDLRSVSMPASQMVRAHFRSSPPVLPASPAEPVAQVRHAPVTQSSSESTGSRAAMPSDVPAAAESTGFPMQPTAGLDVGAVRAYRIALARALASSRLREQLSVNMQGALEVGVAISAAGQVRDIAVLKGSGDATLDGAVVSAMRTVVPQVSFPAAMTGRELVLAIPVEVGTPPATSVADR